MYEYGVKNLTHGISIFSKFLSFLLSCQHLSNISFLTYFIKGQMISKTTFQVFKYFFAWITVLCVNLRLLILISFLCNSWSLLRCVVVIFYWSPEAASWLGNSYKEEPPVNTDSNYMSMSGETIEDVIRPEMASYRQGV